MRLTSLVEVSGNKSCSLTIETADPESIKKNKGLVEFVSKKTIGKVGTASLTVGVLVPNWQISFLTCSFFLLCVLCFEILSESACEKKIFRDFVIAIQNDFQILIGILILKIDHDSLESFLEKFSDLPCHHLLFVEHWW